MTSIAKKRCFKSKLDLRIFSKRQIKNFLILDRINFNKSKQWKYIIDFTKFLPGGINISDLSQRLKKLSVKERKKILESNK